MNIPKYSLENRKVIYFFLAILLIGGVISFFKLPKKEDAPFVIKTAVLVTQYPGANPHEVEKLITEPIERENQPKNIKPFHIIYHHKLEFIPGTCLDL